MRPLRTGWAPAIGLLLAAVAGGGAIAGCPEGDELERAVAALDLERISRVTRFDAVVPEAVYRKALRRPGTPVVHRDGKAGAGVVLAEMPIEPLWVAVSDEGHHALKPEYMPIEQSTLVSGTPHGADRTVFQYFQRFGVGRWWVTRVQVNAELYARSGGKLWEVWWVDAIDDVDPTLPPMSEVAEDIRPINASEGAWLLSPIADGCTLVEFYTWSDPGGAMALGQSMMAGKTIKTTVRGMLTMAAEHSSLPHDGPPFLKPDGTPLGWPVASGSADP